VVRKLSLRSMEPVLALLVHVVYATSRDHDAEPAVHDSGLLDRDGQDDVSGHQVD